MDIDDLLVPVQENNVDMNQTVFHPERPVRFAVADKEHAVIIE